MGIFVKVAHVMNELRHSGAEVMLTSAAPYFLARGPAIVISTGAEVGNYAPTLTAAGYQVAHHPYSASPTFFRALGRFLTREGVDVVHLHSERAAVWYSLMARRYSMPSIRTIHNEFNFTGLLRGRRIISRHIAAASGTVHVACSLSVQQNEKSRFGRDTHLINNWMDPSRVPQPSPASRTSARKTLGLRPEQMVAISVANDAPAKNLSALFRGVTSAMEEGVPILLYHCGSLSVENQRIVDQSNHSIIALGTVPDIWPYLAAADFFLSTSFNEGGQISLLEAAAAGLTCITSKVGNAEAFGNCKGVHFILPTADALKAELYRQTVVPQADRQVAGLELAQWTRSYFLPERGVRQYQDLYMQQLSNAGQLHECSCSE